MTRANAVTCSQQHLLLLGLRLLPDAPLRTFHCFLQLAQFSPTGGFRCCAD